VRLIRSSPGRQLLVSAENFICENPPISRECSRRTRRSMIGWPRRSSPSRPHTRGGSASCRARCSPAPALLTETGLGHLGRCVQPPTPSWGVHLRAQGREVIRASTDGFHVPWAQRSRRGKYSPEGRYTTPSTTTRSAGCCSIRWAPPATAATSTWVIDYPADTALVFDGVFLPPRSSGRWNASSGATQPSQQHYFAIARPITSTSSCTTTSLSGRPGKPDDTDQHTGTRAHRPRRDKPTGADDG
jgi:hypothetical protein